MKNLVWLSLLAFSACASSGQGLLMNFKGGNLEETQLDRHCDLEDAAACLLKGDTLTPTTRLPIVQGVAPGGRTIFALLLAPSETAKLFIFDREDKTKLVPAPPPRVYARGAQPRVEQTEVGDLKPGKTYELIVVDAAGTLIDHRRFRTLAPGARALRFALVSGTDDAYAEEQALQWNDIAAQDPDLIFAIGDNVITTSGDKGSVVTADALWKRYVETRTRLALFRAPTLVPVLATWDDQDIGTFESTGDHAHNTEARLVMEAFFPYVANTKDVIDGPGVSKALRAGGQTFVLFDDRTFRTPNSRPPVCDNKMYPGCEKKYGKDSNEGAHFGRIQEDWAMGIIKDSDGPVWLISGDQWFSGKHAGESFEGNHPSNFSRFLPLLEKSARAAARRNKYPALVFASGSRPAAEATKVKPFGSRYETFEFVTAPLHRETAGVPMNYLLLTTKVEDSGGLGGRAQARALGGKVLYEKEVSVKPLVAKKTKKRN